MKHNLDDILERFWEGETSLEEENALKVYFRSGEVTQNHLEYAGYFGWLDQQASVRYNMPDSRVKEADRLLAAYWEGETSLEDEKKLRDYFAGDAVSEDHLAYADLFSYLEVQRSVKYDTAFSRPESKETKIISIGLRKAIYAAAAVFALLLGSIYVVRNLTAEYEAPAAKTAGVYEVEDPEEAMRITKEALAMVSTKFRQSQEHVKENMGALNKAAIFK